MRFKFSEALRFGSVLAVGLVIDISTGWSLNHFLGVPLWQSTITGFVLGAAFNYVAHELWTFRKKRSDMSAVRGALYLAANVLTLGVRAGTVKLLPAIPVFQERPLAVLLVAVVVPFFVNYQLSASFIFGKRLHHPGSSDALPLED